MQSLDNQNSTPTLTVKAAARKLLSAGVSVIPIRNLHSKAPGLDSWKPYMINRAKQNVADHWFTPNGLPAAPGLAIVCGAVSGNLTVLDFDLRSDGETLFADWAALVEELAPGLVARLPQTTTPSGGRHVFFRCPQVEGNQKLAESSQRQTWIETRGEGGYVLSAPTPGYQLVSGLLTEIPQISAAERALLLDAARSLSGYVADLRPQAGKGGELPGDAYNRASSAHDMARMLERHGWSVISSADGCVKLRRPGKDSGLSATIRTGQGIPIFYCFSTSVADIPAQRGLSPFGLLAAIEHGGDHAAAAAACRRGGFGASPAAEQPKERAPRAGRKEQQPEEPDKPVFNIWEHIKPLRALMTKQFKPATFVVEGVIPSGVTLIAGAPKTGKSLFGWGIALAVANGGYALGKIQVKQRRVLYLMLEDGERLVQKRVTRILQGSQAPENLDYCQEWLRLNEGGVDAIAAYLDRYPDALIVVDTYESLRPLGNPSSDAYRNDYGGLTPLARMAHEREADVIIVHHTSKADRSDPFLTINGSNGMTGAVDTVAILHRVRFGGECVLKLSGRDLDEDKQLALEFNPTLSSHTLLGDAEEVGKSRLQRLVVSALKRARKALKIIEIAELIGHRNDSALRHLLGSMVDGGMIALGERGRYGLPSRKPPAEKEDCEIVNFDLRRREMEGGDPPVDPPVAPSEEGEDRNSQIHNARFDMDMTVLQVHPCPSCGRRYHWKRASYAPAALTCKHCGVEWRPDAL